MKTIGSWVPDSSLVQLGSEIGIRRSLLQKELNVPSNFGKKLDKSEEIYYNRLLNSLGFNASLPRASGGMADTMDLKSIARKWV